MFIPQFFYASLIFTLWKATNLSFKSWLSSLSWNLIRVAFLLETQNSKVHSIYTCRCIHLENQSERRHLSRAHIFLWSKYIPRLLSSISIQEAQSLPPNLPLPRNLVNLLRFSSNLKITALVTLLVCNMEHWENIKHTYIHSSNAAGSIDINDLEARRQAGPDQCGFGWRP